MPFYALRIVCESCASVFVVGGGAENDLTQWRESVVECRRCGSETPAAGGEAVRIGPQTTSATNRTPRSAAPDMAGASR